MAPPGRRRNQLSTVPLILGLLFLFTSTASAAAAVLGIDLGTEYIKAALVKPGIPLEIVLTKDSKRKEASAVAFKPSRSGSTSPGGFPERLYGGDALALAARFPGDVYPNLKPLLGLPATGSPAVEEYSKRHPALGVVALDGKGTVGFKSNSFSKNDAPFSVEELLAMELKNVRQNAEALAGKGLRIENVVITIPTFYTAAERRAVELAADLAGLKVLGLVSDGLAVGLNYATSRTFPSVSEGGKPEYHMVFDMGAGSTTATVLKFQARSVKDVGRFNKTIHEASVVGTGWDKALGGDALNGLIVDDMVARFLETSGAKQVGASAESVKRHGRAMAKLLKEAERLRQVLSANTNTGASFEGLYEDVDFRYKLSRTQYEEMASGLVNRLEIPIKRALDGAKLSFADLSSVILHGGLVRTPFVQKKLETLTGDASKLRSNVNADEAAVFGAAFKGAGLSPSFRVKEIRDSDAASYAVGVQWTADGKVHNQKLFTPTSLIGAAKQIPFKITNDFSFILHQHIPSADDIATASPVLKVQTTNLTESVAQLGERFGCKREDINTQFSIRLDPVDGLPEVVKGSVSCEVEGTGKKSGVVDDVKGFFGFGSKKGSQEPLKEDEESISSSLEVTASSSTAAADATKSTVDTAETPKPVKKRTESINVAFSAIAQGFEELAREEIKRMKDRLAAFDASDKARLLREEALNTLEAFTYRARDLLSDEGFITVSDVEQRSKIEELLRTTSEWLYAEGQSATSEVLKSKLNDLKALVVPVQNRKDEVVKRPEQVRLLKDALDQTQTLLKVMKEQIDSTASSASEAAASASVSASLPTASRADPSPAADPLADLEDVDTSASATATTTPPAPKASDLLSAYTPDDLAELTAARDSISDWLASKQAEQDALAPHEEPALLSTELEAKAKRLNEAIMQLLQKKIKTNSSKARTPPRPKATKKPAKRAKKSGEESVEAAAGAAQPSAGATATAEGAQRESGRAAESVVGEDTAGPGVKGAGKTRDEL